MYLQFKNTSNNLQLLMLEFHITITKLQVQYFTGVILYSLYELFQKGGTKEEDRNNRNVLFYYHE